ncbi:MAG: ABC transporter ATP-binding protein [Lewinellaceae bacterium]|jgi:ABC-2 type transport system ATP-binding protein|nr:ABC transporter ATP-binding protein [Lewinellaceae bacterium]
MINIDHLSKSFAAVQAVKDITLSVEQGEIFGIIGPDGAGKTTLFRMLTSLMLPDSGSASVAGLDVVKDYKRLRQAIGYMPGRFSLYQDLTVEENLGFFAAVFGTSIRENYDLIAPIYSQIEPFKARRAGALSGGMKQKLALCCALIHKPEVLFLDEPGTGVDPVSRKEFWDMLGNLRKQGLTMLVSTPYMDEAALCSRVALMQKGEIMAIDTPDGITKAFQMPLYAVRSDNMYQLIKDLRTLDGMADCYAFGEFAHLKMLDTATPADIATTRITDFLQAKNHRNVEIKTAAPTVEDCFIELMRN